MPRRRNTQEPPVTVLGVDIGGVLIGGRDDAVREEDRDTMFTSRYLETPPVTGGLEALARLDAAGVVLWIVSKAGPRTRQRSLH